MKNYRGLIPIILALLMFVSIYTMVSNAIQQEAKLRSLEEEAATFAEQGLYSKAAAKYSEAISIVDDIKYYEKTIQTYYAGREEQACIAWCEKTIDSFPNEPTGYEWLVKVKMDGKAYADAYKTLDEFEGKRLTSEIMDAYKEQLKTTYYLDYTSASDAKTFSGDYIPLCKQGLWGLGTANGKYAVMPSYLYMGYLCNGLVAVEEQDGDWFFMDSNGEYVYNISDRIEGRIEEVGMYNNDLFPVKVDGRYRYYDIEMNEKPGEYDYAGSYSRGIAAVKVDNAWTLIDQEGKAVIDETFEDIVLDDRGVCCLRNIIIACTDGTYCFYDSDGKKITTSGFDDACLPGTDGLIAVKIEGRWGYVNEVGEVIIEPQYTNAKSFSCGLGAVSNGLNWGYIDEQANLQIDYMFKECTQFSSKGTALVKQAEEWKVIKLYQFNH